MMLRPRSGTAIGLLAGLCRTGEIMASEDGEVDGDVDLDRAPHGKDARSQARES
jgi:hypothetical protein